MILGAVIMAGGYGKRMNSGVPKILHELAGRPMILYTLDTIAALDPKAVVVVVGYKASEVRRVVGEGVLYALQEEPQGTAHAMQTALKVFPQTIDTVVSVYGDDSAFYTKETLGDYLAFYQGTHADMACLTTEVTDPSGLGRILRGQGNRIIGIVEERLATDEEKKITEINTGAYIFNRRVLETLLPRVQKNETGEYFLTDMVSLAIQEGRRVIGYKLPDSSEWVGVNTPEQLARADERMRQLVERATIQ